MDKQKMKHHQLPSYLYLGKIRCAVSYDGQIQTCSFCTEQGHKFKECPKRMQASTSNTHGQDSQTTTPQIPELDEEKPAPAPKERRKGTSNFAETDELRLGATNERSHNAERSDSNERPLEQQENRGSKRKDISGDSNENQEKPETQRCKNDYPLYDFSGLPLG